MTETVEARERLQEAREQELQLRRERAELPQEIARASTLVRDLRGGGKREGDPELEAALTAVRELVDRERALPDLILDAVSTRLELEAESILGREQALAVSTPELQSASLQAQRGLEKARAKAENARAKLSANLLEREKLRREAFPLENFARRARELEGDKRLRLLEDLRSSGGLLPLNDDAGVIVGEGSAAARTLE